jgi:hypothetical protein
MEPKQTPPKKALSDAMSTLDDAWVKKGVAFVDKYW